MEFSETTDSVKEALVWISEGQQVMACCHGFTFQLRDCGKTDTLCGIDEIAPNSGDVVYVESQRRYYIRVPDDLVS